MKAEIYRDRALKWRFRIIADNGEIVAVSQSYFSKWNAKRAIRRIFYPYIVKITVL